MKKYPITSRRSHLRFTGKQFKEDLVDGRYTLIYQGFDDRKPGEVRIEGDFFPWYFEVFDGDDLTYVNEVRFNDDYSRRTFIDGLREAIKSGRHNAHDK